MLGRRGSLEDGNLFAKLFLNVWALGENVHQVGKQGRRRIEAGKEDVLQLRLHVVHRETFLLKHAKERGAALAATVATQMSLLLAEQIQALLEKRLHAAHDSQQLPVRKGQPEPGQRADGDEQAARRLKRLDQVQKVPAVGAAR